jgi:hypothetical protein
MMPEVEAEARLSYAPAALLTVGVSPLALGSSGTGSMMGPGGLSAKSEEEYRGE